MDRMPTEQRLADEADDDAWDADAASFDVDLDEAGFDEAAFDDLTDSDWPRAAVDACAPEGAFDAR